jgi:hypothetical protein
MDAGRGVRTDCFDSWHRHGPGKALLPSPSSGKRLRCILQDLLNQIAGKQPLLHIRDEGRQPLCGSGLSFRYHRQAFVEDSRWVGVFCSTISEACDPSLERFVSHIRFLFLFLFLLLLILLIIASLLIVFRLGICSVLFSLYRHLLWLLFLVLPSLLAVAHRLQPVPYAVYYAQEPAMRGEQPKDGLQQV